MGNVTHQPHAFEMQETITSKKPVASDGSKRGLVRKGRQNRATLLLARMRDEVERKYGIKNFDPAVMLALIGVECMQPTWVEAVDENGKTHKELIPPDRALAVTALSKAAPYVRSQLKSIELTGEDGGPIEIDLTEKKRALATKLGQILEEDLIDITPEEPNAE